MVVSVVGVPSLHPDHFVVGFASPALPLDDGSIVAVALAAGVFLLWLTGRGTPDHQKGDSDDRPDPEVIREMRTSWADDADRDAPPAPMPGGFPDDNPSQNTSGSAGIDLDDLEFPWSNDVDIDFEDVGGMDEVKTELETTVITPLTTGREKAKAFDIPVPNILFHGPPGTGKTFMAEALATELGFPFAELSGSDVQSKWINESPQKIASLFDEAKRVAAAEGGAVVFLDELDAVLKSRSVGGSSHDEDNKVVTEFLNHLEETGEHDVVFIGATNRLDVMDEAGIRSGRIDKMIHVEEPDEVARKKIIRAQLKDLPTDLRDSQIRSIAEYTDGYTAADLASLIDDATRHSAFKRKDDTLRWQDIQAVLSDS